jgi:cyanophycin synthetase
VRLLDSRRLTGANLLTDSPGAVIDVSFGDREPDLVIGAWKEHARRLLAELDWSGSALRVRRFAGGANLVVTAPEDGLYTATELNETAWEAARDWIEGGQQRLLLRAARQLRAEYRDEERPRMMRLLQAARERDLPVLADEDQLTIGLGRRSHSWDLYELPHPDDVDWRGLGRIPTALVTGTNGKTTTVRLLAAIARAADSVAGVSSTDWLAMGDELLDRDDYAGPGGARRVLRDPRCELAILETARGGLLRRGLAVERADVALITNIAADHLGEFGVETIDDLADVKWSVTRALGASGTLVLNAEDPRLVARAGACDARLCLFSTRPSVPAFREHVDSGGLGYTVRRGQLRRCLGGQETSIVAVRRVPICFGGAARHNVANVLAAVAVAEALGLATAAIAAALTAFRSEDNPGRGNLYSVAGATVLVDFAHNPDGLAALLPMIEALPAQRRMLVIGQAGDRGDADIVDYANAAAPLRFDRVLIKRMDGHARGRAQGEVAALLRGAFREQGYAARALGLVTTELDAARAALRWARPGDLVVFLSHEKREATRAFFERRAGAPSEPQGESGG